MESYEKKEKIESLNEYHKALIIIGLEHIGVKYGVERRVPPSKLEAPMNFTPY